MTDRRPVLRSDNSLFTNTLPVKYLELIFCNPSQSSKSRKSMKTGALRGFLENRPTRQFDAISLFLNILPINHLESIFCAGSDGPKLPNSNGMNILRKWPKKRMRSHLCRGTALNKDQPSHAFDRDTASFHRSRKTRAFSGAICGSKRRSLAELSPCPAGQKSTARPARYAAPIAVVSVTAGRTTGTPSMSA